MSSVFGDLVANIDDGLSDIFATAAAGMSGYVMPLAWAMLGVTILVWALLIMEGKVQTPMQDWITKGFYIVIIFQATSTFYTQWISGPLFHLPTDLANAVSGTSGSASASLDVLSDSIDQLLMGVAQALVEAFHNLNFGGAFILSFCMCGIAASGCLLEIACVFNMIYAKIGLALLLGVGPFFIVTLAWQQLKGYFTSWFNTVLYFVFLTVMTTLVELLFIKIANKFMSKLTEAISAFTQSQTSLASNVASMLKSMMTSEPAVTQAVSAQPGLNILSIVIQMILVFLPMFFVAIEIRTLCSSMTGGSGGSFGSGVTNAVGTALNMKRLRDPADAGGK